MCMVYTCVRVGTPHGILTHTLLSPPRPLHIAPTTARTHTQAAKLNSCKTELEASSGFASSLSMLNKYVSTASMLGKGSDCGMLLDHCFKAPSDSLNIFFRCLPRYNITKQYVGKHMRFISGFVGCMGEVYKKVQKRSVAPSPSHSAH